MFVDPAGSTGVGSTTASTTEGGRDQIDGSRWGLPEVRVYPGDPPLHLVYRRRRLVSCNRGQGCPHHVY